MGPERVVVADRACALALQAVGHRVGLALKVGAGVLRRTVAAAGDHEGRGAGRVLEAEVDGREPAHTQAHDVSPLDAEVVEDGDGVRHRVGLAVRVDVLRHVGGRVAAGVVGDTAIAPREMAELRLPTHVVARELVDEKHGWPDPASS